MPTTARTDPVALAQLFTQADSGGTATTPAPSSAALRPISAPLPAPAAIGQQPRVFKVDQPTAQPLAVARAPTPAPQASLRLQAQQAAPAESLATALSSVTARLRATESRLSSAVSLLAAAGRARDAPKGPAPSVAVSLLAHAAPAAAPVAAAVPTAARASAAATLRPASAPASRRTAPAPARVGRNLQPMDEDTVAKRLRLSLATYLSSASALSALAPSAARDTASFQTADGPLSLEDVFAAAVAWQIANGCVHCLLSSWPAVVLKTFSSMKI